MDINCRISDSVALARLRYVFDVFEVNTGSKVNLVTENSSITLGTDSTSTFHISDQFITGELNAEDLDSDGFFITSGKRDYLSTAFYMLSCSQEYTDGDRDDLGRFKYKNSYQARLGIVRKNQVQHCFDQIASRIGIVPQNRPTRFFLSHDIDSVHGAIIEDGFNVIKQGRIDLFFKMLIHVAMGRPDWLNMDQIMKLESEYDCKSTFFWIMNKGKINAREKNADYTFHSESIQKHFLAAEQQGFDNGLHKSISPQSFASEIRSYGKPVAANRYHYLKFHLPEGFDAIEAANLSIDASLGFAETVGFRNSYGLPVNPFNLKENKVYSFVEVPLHIMDRTYFQYLKLSPADAWKDIEAFFEANRSNCVLSILWHNNFFSNYKFKGYLDLYKRILAYIRDNRFNTVSQSELIEQYSLTK